MYGGEGGQPGPQDQVSFLHTLLTSLVKFNSGLGIGLLLGCRASPPRCPIWDPRAGHPAPCFPISCSNKSWAQRGMQVQGPQKMRWA